MTVPVYISFRTLGVSLWLARFAGVVMHLLAVLPIYLLARRIGQGRRPPGGGPLPGRSMAGFQLAGLVREYAYYPFYFFMILLVLVNLLVIHPRPGVFQGYSQDHYAPDTALFRHPALRVGWPPSHRRSVHVQNDQRDLSGLRPGPADQNGFAFLGNRLLGVLAICAAAIAVGALVFSSGNSGSVLTGKFIPTISTSFTRAPSSKYITSAGRFPLWCWFRQ